MVIALTSGFEVLCGFQSMKSIRVNVLQCPELQTLIGASVLSEITTITHTSDGKEVLKRVFAAAMNANADLVKTQVTSLTKRLGMLPIQDVQDGLVSRLAVRFFMNFLCFLPYLSSFFFLFLTVSQKQYPGDVGVFCPYFFNYVILGESEGMFVPANEPHSYISGDGIGQSLNLSCFKLCFCSLTLFCSSTECMAASDNVVRAGLTTKFRDVSVLCKMLSYRSAPPSLFSGTVMDECTKLYIPPYVSILWGFTARFY